MRRARRAEKKKFTPSVPKQASAGKPPPVPAADLSTGRAAHVSIRGFDLLLNMAAELERAGNLVKLVRSTADSPENDRAVAEHPSPEWFHNADAFNSRKQQFEGFARGNARLDQHPLICNDHFRGVALRQAPGGAERAGEQHGSSERGTRGWRQHRPAGRQLVNEECNPGDLQNGAGHHAPEHRDPMELGAIKDGFARNQIPFDITHGGLRARLNGALHKSRPRHACPSMTLRRLLRQRKQRTHFAPPHAGAKQRRVAGGLRTQVFEHIQNLAELEEQPTGAGLNQKSRAPGSPFKLQYGDKRSASDSYRKQSIGQELTQQVVQFVPWPDPASRRL